MLLIIWGVPPTSRQTQWNFQNKKKKILSNVTSAKDTQERLFYIFSIG